ncbi:MAG TPA: hypothetical protein VN840_06740 [Streptosporangiaceae bacterium]|nr:hypothetical protein [Streptosporangiaceae bacterium]
MAHTEPPGPADRTIRAGRGRAGWRPRSRFAGSARAAAERFLADGAIADLARHGVEAIAHRP